MVKIVIQSYGLDILKLNKKACNYQVCFVFTQNRVHGESVLDNPSKTVDESLVRQLKNLKKEMKYLEDKLFKIVKFEYQASLILLKKNTRDRG